MEKARECAGYERELSKLSDEQLVILAAQCACPSATNVLLLRYYDWSNQLIKRLARRSSLVAMDVEDALQNAVFGILKAIARYDSSQFTRANGCPFPAFLRRVLTDHFKDFVKHLRRMEARYTRPGFSYYTSAPAANGERAMDDYREERVQEPFTAAVSQELGDHVQEALGQLDDMTKKLLEGVMAGMRLRAIANALGISYDAAKRRWRRVRAKLAEQLRESVG